MTPGIEDFENEDDFSNEDKEFRINRAKKRFKRGFDNPKKYGHQNYKKSQGFLDTPKDNKDG